ncbi:hypothetical protein [Beduini massiliensis]|uniref:hypothetical protein n=1 Tax=Beduini massiliensis TaxID=1585974 RepID=UPI00059A8841|nr:hypothetical protein [Beduini massiliensis]
MAVMNDMQLYQLQKLNAVRGPSGQEKQTWLDIENIKVAVYLIDEMSVVGSVRYDQYDYAGLTFYNGFEKKEKYRIVGEETYGIERAVQNGNLMHLLLKAVDV